MTLAVGSRAWVRHVSAVAVVGALVCLCGPGAPADEPPPAQDIVYLSKEDALRRVFATSERVTAERHVLTDAQVASAEDIARWKLPRREYVFYIGHTGDAIDGYALIDDERGKYHPITFIVAFTPAGEVRHVEVMVYRESMGDGVRRRPFLRQFEGKGAAHVQRFRYAIRHITGATISSRSMMIGVGRAIAVWQAVYGAGRPVAAAQVSTEAK